MRLLFGLMILLTIIFPGCSTERTQKTRDRGQDMNNLNKYAKITANDFILDVINHPAFEGRGRLLFPWDNDSRYSKNMTMRNAGPLHLWHTNMNVDEMVAGVNYLIDEINAGKKVLYDFYTEEDKASDRSKENTGLFFLRGEPGAPFAVISPGGGFTYVGSLHEGFPIAMEINKRGYNAFVLKYRVGQGETVSSIDLIAAVNFIIDHSEELSVASGNYSLWGGSAGARISSNVTYGEGGISRPNTLRPAAAIMAYTTHPGSPDFVSSDPAGFFMVGTNDWIVPVAHVENRAAVMKEAGINVECIVYRGIGHGYAVGKGTIAEGWLDKAIKFWEANMKN